MDRRRLDPCPFPPTPYLHLRYLLLSFKLNIGWKVCFHGLHHFISYRSSSEFYSVVNNDSGLCLLIAESPSLHRLTGTQLQAVVGPILSILFFLFYPYTSRCDVERKTKPGDMFTKSHPQLPPAGSSPVIINSASKIRKQKAQHRSNGRLILTSLAQVAG